MEPDDVFTFCQSELPKTSFGAFQNMKNRKKFCDLTIRVQNQSLTAHRMILSAGIPYFKSLFASSEEVIEPKEITIEDSVDPSALEALINFAYTTQVDISFDNVNSLLMTSQFLQLDSVFDACVDFLSKKLTVDNVVQIHTLAHDLNNSVLIENSKDYIRKNFEVFSQFDDFLSLPHSFVKEIIGGDDLIVSREEVVFEAVLKWVKFDPSERHQALPELLSEVRMIYLPFVYLRECVDAEELISACKLCSNLVNDVKYYHLFQEKSAFTYLKTQPRHNKQDIHAVCACDTRGYSVYHFDVGNRQWIPLATKKASTETINGVVAVNGMIYMFLTEVIQTFCLKTHKWEVLSEKHKGMEGATIVSQGKLIYCFGSEKPKFMSKMRTFNTKMNIWGRDKVMKKSRWDAAASVMGEIIYLTGGYNGNTAISASEKYNCMTHQWSDIAPMLTPRESHGCCSVNGKVYICGGNTTGGSILNTAEVYDPLTGSWDFISPMSNTKYGFSMTPLYGKIYALKKCCVEVYDPVTDLWKSSVPVPEGFSGAVTILAAAYVQNGDCSSSFSKGKNGCKSKNSSRPRNHGNGVRHRKVRILDSDESEEEYKAIKDEVSTMTGFVFEENSSPSESDEIIAEPAAKKAENCRRC